MSPFSNWSPEGKMPPAPPGPSADYVPGSEKVHWNWDRIRWGNKTVDKNNWTKVGTQPKSDDEPDWRGVVKNNVIALEPPEPYDFGQHTDPNYFWFDTPDYADPFKKLWFSFKWFLNTGLIAASTKGIVAMKTCTWADHVLLLKSITFPWLIAGMAASTAIVTVANLRGKKDDYYNYVAGGLVLGSILGKKNHLTWFKWTVGSVPLVVYVKHNAEVNGKIWPRVSPRIVNWSTTGLDAENGWKSGDLRFGLRSTYGDPGRDVRKVC